MPAEINDTWDKLGIPQPEKKYLAGVKPNSNPRSFTVAAGRSRAKGVIFTDIDSALRDHPDIVSSISARSFRRTTTSSRRSSPRSGRADRSSTSARREDRISAAGLLPDQCREHGPVRADADHRRRRRRGALRRRLHRSDVHDRELHSAVVEIVVKPRGRCRYTTIQNWANNIYNLVTKRALAYEARRWSGSTATSAPS